MEQTIEAIEKSETELSKQEIPAGILKITNYYDNVKLLCNINPFFYDTAKIFWIWNKLEFRWEMVDETDVLIMIDRALNFGGQLITSKVKGNYMEAFKQVGRSNTPEDMPKHWLQFKDQFYDLETRKVSPATPKYFCCNPIPWKLGKSVNTPVMDRLFTEWVGSKFISTLYEIIAYSCVADYPIHRMFCLVGGGRNGKSQYQKVIQNFIGATNICSTELDLLIDNRFESAKLYKKLVCTLGETNFGVMSKTSLLKKLTGGDLIGYEFKNKTPFDDYNYAKIIINSNSLPSSLDTSDGFYRRWLILEFPNEFPEGKDIIATIPEVEYDNLARKSALLISKLIETGSFSNEGTIEERKKRYIMASNPLPHFLKSFCSRGVDDYITTNELYNAYIQYLNAKKKRKVSRKEFFDILADEGLFQIRTTRDLITDRFIEGIKLVDDWKILIYA